MCTTKQYLFTQVFFLLLFMLLSTSGFSQKNETQYPFPYDTNLNKFMYKGSFMVEGLNSDQLFELTFFCYDSLHFIKTKKLDETGLTAIPLDVNDNYGLRKSRSQHWFKHHINFILNESRDSILVVDATYMTIDNAVMYQYRDFRLDTVSFLDSKNRHKNSFPFEKAVKEGLPIDSVSWIDERIRERMEEIKQCVLRNKNNWQGVKDRRKDAKLEGQ